MAVSVDVLIETQGEVCLLPLPGDQQSGCFRRCGSASGSAVAINRAGHAEVQPPAGTGGRAESRAYQALVAQAEIELAFHSPEQSEAGMHAGVTGWQSMTWKPVLAVGRAFPVTGRNGTLAVEDMPFWQVIAEASLAAREAGTLSVRWSGGWCRTNSGRRRERQQSHRLPVNSLNERVIFRKVSVVSVQVYGL